MEPTHPNLRGRKEAGLGRCQALGFFICGGLARGKAPITLEIPRTYDSLALVVRLVAIYLGLILIEFFLTDDCFIAIRCPEIAGSCRN